MSKQVLMIHGGTTFHSEKDYLDYLKNKEVKLERIVSHEYWSQNVAKDLGEEYMMLTPKMPNSTNAQYEEWKIWFEKILGVLDREIILIGHSLGGIFLVKYLAGNTVDKEIKATFLLGAPFDDELEEESLVSFALPENISGFSAQAGKIFLLHSKDDPCVPFGQALKYKKVLSEAELIVFEDKGHFNDEKFPELPELIKKTCFK